MILEKKSCKKREGDAKMHIEIKKLKKTDQYIGYLKIDKTPIFALITDSIDENLKGIKEWIAVKKQNTTFC